MNEEWILSVGGTTVKTPSHTIRLSCGPMGQSHSSHVIELKKRKETARLISAAPNLLKALENFVETVEMVDPGVYRDSIDLAMMAISKAKEIS